MFIEPFKKKFVFVLFCITFDASGFHGSYSENMKLIFVKEIPQRSKLNKIMQFGADVIYMDKN